MRCLALSLTLVLVSPTASIAQSAYDGSCHSDSAARPSYQLYAQSNIAPEAEKPSKWRVLGRGIARAARVAVAATAVTAAEALRAYSQYSSYPSGYGSTYSSTLGSTAYDSCSHGYTEATCPYGSNGGSYGTAYLSGGSSIRTRSDGFGNYRYYTSDGRYGNITRSYSGSYRVTNNDGDTITASASSLRSMGYRIPYESGF